MIHFECDYACGAAEPVLQALLDTNRGQTRGYGEDEHCQEARELIRQCCAAPGAGVHFLVGGTQVNMTVIAAALQPYEGALCASTGHIAVHETGAVESTGHKVLTLPHQDGKITGDQIRQAMQSHLEDDSFEHMVRPGLVYLSHPTELGTLYTRQELEDISAACHEYGLPLYLDGARLLYALAAEPEVDLPFLARVCDAFTIGGTKAGLLFGEALVITRPELNRNFRYHIKQRGGMLAKGRLLGVQFKALLKDDACLNLADRANGMAQLLKNTCVEAGCSLWVDTPANQIFPILPNGVLEKLKDRYCWSFMGAMENDCSAVRFCTSVCTRLEDVLALQQDLQRAFAEKDA